jgi:acetyl esterase/lipase
MGNSFYTGLTGLTRLGKQNAIAEVPGTIYSFGSMDDCRVEQNLFYGGEDRCRLDLCLPATQAYCTLIWFHGGGLTEGDKSWGERMAKRFARHGIVSVLVNYRLSGMTQYPGYILDAARAVGWVFRNAETYGLDRQKIYLGGSSAGGYLAAMLAMDERYLQVEGVAVSDLRGATILSGQVGTHFQVCKERGLPANAVVSDEASPMYYARKGVIPFQLLVGDNDIPNRLEENQLFFRALKNAGNDNVSFQIIPGRNHPQMSDRLHEEDDSSGELILSFLKG